MRPKATNVRDAGLELISRVNRWMIAAAVAATGAISLAAANSFHGHTAATGSSASQPASTSSGSGAGTTSNSSANSGSSTGLQQPAQAPAASSGSSSAPVVSGGS